MSQKDIKIKDQFLMVNIIMEKNGMELVMILMGIRFIK